MAHQNDEVPFYCNSCDFTSLNHSFLLTHRSEHHIIGNNKIYSETNEKISEVLLDDIFQKTGVSGFVVKRIQRGEQIE